MTGLSRTCECLSIWLPADERFLPCPFYTDDHVLHFKYRPSSLEKKCQCPDIDMIGGRSDVSTTIFCLIRHLSISSRVRHSAKNATRTRHFIFPESTTSTQSHISNILPSQCAIFSTIYCKAQGAIFFHLCIIQRSPSPQLGHNVLLFRTIYCEAYHVKCYFFLTM